jgi:uncharacterized membrane protein
LHIIQAKIDAPSVTLAIQTLRNTILVAIFVGGSSFQYAYISLNGLESSSNVWQICRVVILATLLFSSFFCWANVIRSASHLGYYIGTIGETLPLQIVEEGRGSSLAVKDDGGFDTDEEAIRLVKSMLICFSLGFRFLFVSIPYVFFNIGPLALIISTFMIMLFLYSIDHNHRKTSTSKIES